jgi:ferredoxin
MNEKKPEPDYSLSFFQEGTAEIFATPRPVMPAANGEEPGPRLPVLPSAPPAPEKEQKAYWRALRLFLRSGKGGGIAEKVFPAALAPFRDQPFLEGLYPCWVGEGLEANLMPVGELIRQSLLQFAPGAEQARILRDNLPRLQQIIREMCRHNGAALPSGRVWEESFSKLNEQLDIQGGEGQTFRADLANLQHLLPKSGWVMPFSEQTPLFLFSALVHDHTARYRRRIAGETAQLIAQLEALLAVEREKSPEAHTAEHLHDAMDFAGSFLNFEEMSHLLPQSGSVNMPADRLKRLEGALATLRRADDLLFAHSSVFILEKGLETAERFAWNDYLPLASVTTTPGGQAVLTAIEHFDRHAGNAAAFFSAVRLAQLEIAGQYKPELHDDFFAHFNWRQFSDAEMEACMPVVACTRAASLLDSEWKAFAEVLTTGRPIKTMAFRLSGEEEYRQEPGALAIAHRDAYVMQSAAIQPDVLYQGLREGLSGNFPALFHLLVPDAGFLMPGASAAVEGREFPGFTFDCRKGPRWGSRFDIHDNPEPEADWPLVSLDYRTAEGGEENMEMLFTFADYAALHPGFSQYFHLVPAAQWTEDLVPVSSYLDLSEADRYSKVPFIWVINGANELVKAAIAWPLVQLCRERLDFWHFLQENAGVHSYHVEQATERLRAAMLAEQEKGIEALKTEHESQIAAARETAAREAMERLAAVLLDMDFSELAPKKAAPAPAPVPESAPAAETPAPQPPAQKAEEPLALGEVWIESALCTACNECININKLIFQYNANKQAFVANPAGGPFSDIVKAAEGCPVSIIHPGAPQNPNEPGLEMWVKRAEKFN